MEYSHIIFNILFIIDVVFTAMYYVNVLIASYFTGIWLNKNDIISLLFNTSLMYFYLMHGHILSPIYTEVWTWYASWSLLV